MVTSVINCGIYATIMRRKVLVLVKVVLLGILGFTNLDRALPSLKLVVAEERSI